MELEPLTTLPSRVVWALRPLLPADGPLAVLQISPGAPAGFAWVELLSARALARLEVRTDQPPPRPVAIPAALLADFRRVGGDRGPTLRLEAAPDGRVALFTATPQPLRLLAPEPALLPPITEHLVKLPGPWHCPEPGRLLPPVLMDPALLARGLRAMEAAAGKPVELQLLDGRGPIRVALLPSVNADEIGGGSLQLAGMAERRD